MKTVFEKMKMDRKNDKPFFVKKKKRKENGLKKLFSFFGCYWGGSPAPTRTPHLNVFRLLPALLQDLSFSTLQHLSIACCQYRIESFRGSLRLVPRQFLPCSPQPKHNARPTGETLEVTECSFPLPLHSSSQRHTQFRTTEEFTHMATNAQVPNTCLAVLQKAQERRRKNAKKKVEEEEKPQHEQAVHERLAIDLIQICISARF